MDTVDVNEITKEIDGIYKNILENFNPASRQMIATGKAYLKSLHGASAASSMYLDSMVRLSKQAQQSSMGNSGDIGTSLMQITDVFKEIHTQQLNTLKAFYVDFLVPLENNLEKDTRVIQNEQKKFLVSHKQRVDSFNKAAANVKKMKKKCKRSSSSCNTIDKEIKVMQNLEEERSKLEAFCEKSMQEALTQERRRYGFILERQASLAKHYLAFYCKGNSLLSQKQEMWMNIAKSRETLPEFMQNKLLKRIHGGEEECIYCSPRRAADDHDTASVCSQLRKVKSMDASEIINLQSPPDLPITSAGSLSRAKSDLNLLMNGVNVHEHHSSSDNPRPKSIAVAADVNVNMNNPSFAKALYAYLSSGENQLSFHEGDTIALIGERNKGWQFGENVRTQKTGWFPVAYTELEASDGKLSPSPAPPPMPPPPPAVVTSSNNMYNQEDESSAWRIQKKKLNLNNLAHRAADNSTNNRGGKSPGAQTGNNLMIPTSGGRASDSLHSSNDSGFSNDLGHNGQVPTPPQPDIDYSDDEPNLSNSETNPGEKWLMDRYHMSESVRIGSNRKRSLSFNNVSGAEIRNRIQSHAHNYESYSNNKEGPLKKFLNRTKSLIFKRSVDEKIDSISVASSMSDLWGSHDSIVRLSDLQRKEKAMEGNDPPTDSISNSNSQSSNTISANTNSSSEYPKVVSIKEDSPPPPIPPPLPSREELHKHRKNISSSANTGKNTTSSSSSPIKDSESCIVIKDHTRQKIYNHDESHHYGEKNSKVARQKLPPKKVISMDVDITEAQMTTKGEKISKAGKHANVNRMESFGCSEAPIVPMNYRRSNNATSMKSTQGSVSSRKPDTFRSARSVGIGRSYIVEAHKSNRTSRYGTINSYSDNLEEEDDQVDDFDDDDDYEDNSSVFAEQIVEEKKVSKISKEKVVKKEEDDTIDTLRTRRHGGYKKGDSAKLKSQSLRIVSANSGSMSSSSKQLAVYREGSYENPSEVSSFVPKINSKLSAEITDYPNLRKGKSVGSVKSPQKRPTQFKGSFRSEVHTVELIATDTDDEKPGFDYGRHIHRRLYYPERASKLDQKSERSGNLCGPWYDLWGIDPSVSLG